MKHPAIQKNLHRLLLTLASCAIVSISSCEESPEKTEPPSVNLVSFSAKDRGNEGNASDIRLSCSFSGSLEQYEKLRFILSPSATLDITKALSLSPDNYIETDLASNVDTYLSAGLKDSEGELVTEGKAYSTFILVLPPASSGDPILMPVSEVLTLVDEIVVTTPTFKEHVSANEDISIDTENNLYVSGGMSNPATLFKISADGTVVQLSNSLNHAVGNTLDGSGNVYVTNFQSTNINLVTPAGATTVFIADNRLVGGGGIIIDNNGMIYNTFYSTKTIYKMSQAGSIENFATSDKLNGPVGMAYDKVNDKIFVSNFTDGKIFLVTKEGAISEVTDTPATIGHLDYRDEVFYATGYNENRIYLISTSGEILKTIGSGNRATADGASSEASFLNPNGIAVSKDGKFIYVSQMDGVLRKIAL